ncbi:MAG: 16S rRNA (cytosine(1402)-N(4))-methyltransferase [Gallionellales bacterium 35-53-114]|nr:MAG: 16S rRNA (cytosine(1402)-N(4))-methyltransferase [Gallionellales bacterium 35-53-114]OYZ63919.1 MAG: 16S rRNA (cytosine(1402)-N(4))-methyltransferase [Gallionellales bacterium 24-53-125]OZB09252.1 MAG: 16S rRNA (cytosine(1402)-N(4))-methyltransferase [Gallionellales bacterium 39-52-133]HQS59146.1 16S rRNA (cytosine(1402)-N(4))-methyltransferase RsmH [Gallionellaceae bacterium]HQS75882.1 16S rRNA (cytosine(1402)-N(4))-methyltransferase RsmH [Gallionellaceae bacterium]
MSEELQHATVLLHEAVEALQIQPQGIYVDGTFGRGGHSRLILQKLGPQGRLIALDKDLAAIAAGQSVRDARFQLVHSGFEALGSVLKSLAVDKVDGVLLDLGVSSPQLDDAARGFSFRFDAPLDMRMDTSSGQTAAEWLAQADESLLSEVIRDYGEERFAKQIARAIVAARKEQAILTTRQLSEVVAKVVRTREPGKNPATRTFQAIRIYINRELEELTHILPQCVDSLKPGGRLAVISFHSLEDRIVKRFMRDMAQGDKMPMGLPIRAADIPQGKLKLCGKAVYAGEAELAVNPRARSAVLRVAERINDDGKGDAGG